MTETTKAQPSTLMTAVLIAGSLGLLLFAGIITFFDPQYRAVGLLNEAYVLIDHAALQQPGPDSLMMAAADGMMSQLDPYCDFLSPERQERVREVTEGLYSGIGVEMVIHGGVITIISPIPGSPADCAGLQPGDRIVEIDGKSARNITSFEASERVRGEPGTTVRLGIERTGREEILEFNVIRDEISIQPVSYAGVTADSIGYVRLVSFSPRAGEQIDSVLLEFNKAGAKGWILDLRGNPGGYLDVAIDVAGCFLPEGALVCETRGRHRSYSYDLKTHYEPVSVDVPLVILLDGGSASASEIVAGAITDYRRGVLVGRPSFGKGLVQSLTSLGHDYALQLTTGRYFTPGGYSFSGWRLSWDADSLPADDTGLFRKGLNPDIAVARTERPVLEADLMQSGVFLNFVASGFEATGPAPFDKVWTAFSARLNPAEEQWSTELEGAIAEIESVAVTAVNAPAWGRAFAGVGNLLAADRARALKESLPRLRWRLAETLIQYGGAAGQRYLADYLALDPDTRTAVEVLCDSARYKALLAEKADNPIAAAEDTESGRANAGF